MSTLLLERKLNLMLRSFIPFILAILGITMISWATKLPLFEWQLSEITTDFSSACDGNLPSQWITNFGDTLDVRERASLLENLNIVVRRSRNDEALDRVSLGLYDNRAWLFGGVIISLIYIWLFPLQDKQSRVSQITKAVFLTAIAISICFFLTQVVRLAGPAIGWIPYYSEIWDCHGTVSFNARLSKIHYETLTVLLAAILSELGAFGVMMHQMKKGAVNRNGSSNW